MAELSAQMMKDRGAVIDSDVPDLRASIEAATLAAIPQLPVAQAGAGDTILGVQGDQAYRFARDSIPLNPADQARIVAIEGGQQQLESTTAALSSAQTALDARVNGVSTDLDTAEARIGSLEASQGSGVTGYATRAELPATAPAGTIAFVTNDPTAANNGAFRWSGSAWVKAADTTTALATDVAVLRTSGQLLLNRGADFPQRQATYNGTTSTKFIGMANAIVGVRVIGARPGKLYAIRYFANGSTELAGNFPFGWAIAEHDAATYASSAASTVVQARTDTAPEFPLSGLPETVRIVSTRVPGITVEIVVDTSQLPAWGTSLNASTAARPGYSWIVDPWVYELAGDADGAASFEPLPALFTISETQRSIAMAWQLNQQHLFRTRWQPNGFNGLFNFLGLDRSPVPPGGLEAGTWSAISTSSTDWIPPVALLAESGDGSGLIYTGGNHGSNGDASGAQTARMTEWTCWVDGVRLAPGRVFGGRATEVIVRWVNELMASNTISYPRYVLRQTVVARFIAGHIEVMIEHEAMEPLTVRTDNGLQMRGDAYETSVQYYDGTAQRRQSAEQVTDSGPKSEAPNAWAISTRGSYGYQTAWLDHGVGKGDGSSVAPSAPMLRKNANSWKFYQAIVASAELVMATGDTYEYRGGYAWTPPEIVTGNVDSAFVFAKAGRRFIGWAYSGPGPYAGGRLHPPGRYFGSEVVEIGRIVGPAGLAVPAAAYAAPQSEMR